MMYIIYTMLYIIYLGKQKIFSQFQFQNSQERLIDALVWGKGGWLAQHASRVQPGPTNCGLGSAICELWRVCFTFRRQFAVSPYILFAESNIRLHFLSLYHLGIRGMRVASDRCRGGTGNQYAIVYNKIHLLWPLLSFDRRNKEILFTWLLNNGHNLQLME